MQLIDKNNIIERMLYYWSKMYTKQIKVGDDYNKLEKTIVILIADFNIKGLEEVEYHSTWKIIITYKADYFKSGLLLILAGVSINAILVLQREFNELQNYYKNGAL